MNKLNLLTAFVLLLNFSVFSQTPEKQIVNKDSIWAKPLNEILVLGEQNVRRNSSYQFTVSDVKPLVTILGEIDPLRYIGTLPGVSQGMEGGMAFFVRGSNSGNNRIELDGVPLYGSAHLFGLFSTIPASAVGSVTFLSGKIPASSGNFSSSLTQVYTNQTDTSKTHGGFSISPFILGANFSAPLVKNKLLLQVAGRYSLLYPEIKLVQSIVTSGDNDLKTEIMPQVMDLFAKLNYKIDGKNTLSLSGYFSNDYFRMRNKGEFSDLQIEMNWSNAITRLGWDLDLNDKLRISTLAYYNNYITGNRQQNFSDSRNNSDLRLHTTLNEFAVQSEAIYQNRKFKLNTGLQFKTQSIKPAAERMYIGQNSNNPNRYAYEPVTNSNFLVVFGNGEYKYNIFTVSLGLRETFYFTETNKFFDSNIRASLAAELTKQTGVELSYDQFTQFHHVLEGLPVGWSLDLLIPADTLFRPEHAQQWYGGGFWTNKVYMLSGGAYYKVMNNLTMYKNAANIFGVQNANWIDEIASGKGVSYGLELRAERKGVRWNAALSYTLSKTTRQYVEINDGKTFPFKFDRRHILNLTGQILLKKKPKSEKYFNMSFSYSSGNHITLPIGIYQGVELPYWNAQSGIYIPPRENDNIYYRQLMSSVNGYQMPYYMRLDIGYNYHKIAKHCTHDFTIGVFNMLNRQNPYLIYNEDGIWKQLSIFPIIPSIQWSLNF
jgi:hypothetical protein